MGGVVSGVQVIVCTYHARRLWKVKKGVEVKGSNCSYKVLGAKEGESIIKLQSKV